MKHLKLFNEQHKYISQYVQPMSEYIIDRLTYLEDEGYTMIIEFSFLHKHSIFHKNTRIPSIIYASIKRNGIDYDSLSNIFDLGNRNSFMKSKPWYIICLYKQGNKINFNLDSNIKLRDELVNRLSRLRLEPSNSDYKGGLIFSTII